MNSDCGGYADYGQVYKNKPALPLQYNGDLERMTQIHSFTPDDHCLTTMCILTPPGHSVSYSMLTGGSNGRLDFWDVGRADLAVRRTQDSTSHPIHQSAINDSMSFWLNQGDPTPNNLLIVSVGDDNAIGLSLMQGLNLHYLHSFKPGSNPHSLLVQSAHAASITAVVCVSSVNALQMPCHSYARGSNHERSFIRIVTASKDQKLKVWDISVELRKPRTSGMRIKHVKTIASDVADASSLAVLPGIQYDDDKGSRSREVLVCGVGMEIWKVPV